MADYDTTKTVSCDLAGIDPATCAVLVIDELGEYAGSDLEAVLGAPTENTARILQVARANGNPVIFCNDAHLPEIDRELELWGEHNMAGSEAARPTAILGKDERDFTIEKRRYSAFFQTSLRLLLSELGVKTLVLCGFDTNICVVHTAADAYFSGFDLIVVDDATATFLIGDQQSGLVYMNRCYGAKIVDTQDVIALLND